MCLSSPKAPAVKIPDPVPVPPAPKRPERPQLSPVLKTDNRKNNRTNLTINRPSSTGVSLSSRGTGVNVPG